MKSQGEDLLRSIFESTGVSFPENILNIWKKEATKEDVAKLKEFLENKAPNKRLGGKSDSQKDSFDDYFPFGC